MKRLGQLILLVISLSLILMGVLAKVYFTPETLAPWTTNLLKEHLGQDVSLASVEFKFLPLELQVRDLRFNEIPVGDNQDLHHGQVRLLSVRPNYFHLLSPDKLPFRVVAWGILGHIEENSEPPPPKYQRDSTNEDELGLLKLQFPNIELFDVTIHLTQQDVMIQLNSAQLSRSTLGSEHSYELEIREGIIKHIATGKIAKIGIAIKTLNKFSNFCGKKHGFRPPHSNFSISRRVSCIWSFQYRNWHLLSPKIYLL